ncbi:hypothetical protein GH714_017208 [Hevea brasiliensis]|uniref:Uncharacterized protein n=1 Tax=Hevea brasiliensis TaxID=3981 RepID=A0A6A6NCV9_HEVBR|nr:hypothetical protein GH714_017208 [Hevea brasiliensis]
MHIDIHNLEKLSDDNCRHLLETYAFHNQVSHSSHSVFEDVGKKIAENCRGLPLVLKTVGSLLRSKRNVQEWEEILKNMLPSDNILSTLKLSYYSLPSHLKQCFAYCGIFPKAYEFYKEDLVRLWMAEGFIIEAKDGNDNEVVGDAYFNDLVSRSFFQMSGGSQKCFVMHDHIYDLAKSISGEFCFMMEGKDSSVEVPSKTRYLYVRHGDSCHSHGYYKFIIAKVNKSQVLRTFFSDKYFHGSYRVMHALLPKFKHLRVLFLYDYRKKKLPNSIGNLKHLRYLNFRGASIRKLPHSMSSLYNLQTLILRDCRYLVKLPTNMKG